MTNLNCYICSGECCPTVKQGKYTYYQCQDCRNSQLYPVPSELDLEDYYNVFHLGSQQGGTYDDFESRMLADFPFKAAMAKQLASGIEGGKTFRLLDVGCGKGYFLKEAEKHGFKSSGIDLSRSAVRHARDVLNVDAYVGRIEKEAPSEWNGAFDVATFWASIEHLPDPLPVLTAIARCLKPNGLLLCDTGLGGTNLDMMLAGYSQWYDAPQHIFVFSADGLTSLLRKAGFEILSVDTNCERNIFRRFIRQIRHAFVCMTSFCLFRPVLGHSGFQAVKQSAKWPIGRLVLVISRKR